MNKDEAKLTIEAIELSDAFVEAKKNRKKDEAAYQKAKKKMSEHRTYWRQIRDAVRQGIDKDGNPVEPVVDEEGDATASPKTTSAKSGVN